MKSTSYNLVEHGAYTIAQLATFAEIRHWSKVKRWLFGSSTGAAALEPFAPDPEIVSFVDLAQVMAVRNILAKRQVSLQRIREAIQTATEHGVRYPFAQKHQAWVQPSGHVAIRLENGLVIGATGKNKHHGFIEKYAVHPVDDLGFDASGMASSYTPEHEKGRKIVLRPGVRFGAPVVVPCGYTVETLVCAVEAEGSILKAARVVGVDQGDIRLAIRYDERLNRIAA